MCQAHDELQEGSHLFSAFLRLQGQCPDSWERVRDRMAQLWDLKAGLCCPPTWCHGAGSGRGLQGRTGEGAEQSWHPVCGGPSSHLCLLPC